MGLKIKRIKVSDSEKELFMLTDYTEQKGLNVRIVDVKDGKAYSGSVTEQNLRMTAAEIRMTYSSYLSDALCALYDEDPMVQNEYLYLFNPAAKDSLQLAWKKIIKDVKIDLGSIDVEQKDFRSVLSDILTLTSTEIKNYYDVQKKLKEEVGNLAKKQAELQALLDEAVGAKVKLETELYTKFSIILNNKKRKIRELHEALESAKSAGNPKKAKVVERPSRNYTRCKKPKNDPSVRKDLHQAGPSKVANEDFSLLLSSEDEIKHVKQSKPRIRRIAKGRSSSDNPTKITNKQVAEIKNDEYEDDETDEDIDGLLNEM